MKPPYHAFTFQCMNLSFYKCLSYVEFLFPLIPQGWIQDWMACLWCPIAIFCKVYELTCHEYAIKPFICTIGTWFIIINFNNKNYLYNLCKINVHPLCSNGLVVKTYGLSRPFALPIQMKISIPFLKKYLIRT
jgi:hypothetical protein